MTVYFHYEREDGKHAVYKLLGDYRLEHRKNYTRRQFRDFCNNHNVKKVISLDQNPKHIRNLEEKLKKAIPYNR